MKIIDYLKRKKKEDLPLIARVNLSELQKQREEEMQDREVSILATADYTKRIATIRLIYTSLNRFTSAMGEKVCQNFNNYGSFRLPSEMSYEDAYKVISYISEKIEKQNKLIPASLDSVAILSKTLGNYGFEKVHSLEDGQFHITYEYDPLRRIRTSIHACQKIDGIVDLFTVGGDFRLFKKSDLHNRYFNWFTEGITEQQVYDIYKNIRKEHLLPDDIIPNEIFQ